MVLVDIFFAGVAYTSLANHERQNREEQKAADETGPFEGTEGLRESQAPAMVGEFCERSPHDLSLRFER
jgi:hypothetical protein